MYYRGTKQVNNFSKFSEDCGSKGMIMSFSNLSVFLWSKCFRIVNIEVLPVRVQYSMSSRTYI